MDVALTGLHHLVEQRQIVKDPERTSLRRGDQILLAFMDSQICDRNHGKIKLHRTPFGAVVKRQIQPVSVPA